MQELFLNKIHFFNFFSMSDKTPVQQLKDCHFYSQYSTSFPDFLNVSIRMGKYDQGRGKYPMLRTDIKHHQLIKLPKISYSIASLKYHKFLCGAYLNGLNQGISNLKYSEYLKKYEPCQFNAFFQLADRQLYV